MWGVVGEEHLGVVLLSRPLEGLQGEFIVDPRLAIDQCELLDAPP